MLKWRIRNGPVLSVSYLVYQASDGLLDLWLPRDPSWTLSTQLNVGSLCSSKGLLLGAIFHNWALHCIGPLNKRYSQQCLTTTLELLFIYYLYVLTISRYQTITKALRCIDHHAWIIFTVKAEFCLAAKSLSFLIILTIYIEMMMLFFCGCWCSSVPKQRTSMSR